jgi:GDPmannose 4,6-dehydratase
MVNFMSNEARGRKAFLTGITGQDGSYLAEFLLEKGYEVHALAFTPPPGAPASMVGAQTPHPEVHLHEGDLASTDVLADLIAKIRPDELYNLGAQTHVLQSHENPEAAVNITGLGPLRLLEAVRTAGLDKKTRFFQASSAELFGNPTVSPQDESTPICPRNPYGAAKAFAHWILTQYRESHGMFNCSGILYNHESPRRGEAFVTRKITTALAQIVAGRQKILALGNLDARRDWGFAGDYVEAMWRMLQQPEPEDYVIATGRTHSIREFLDEAFGYAGLDWKDFVVVDTKFVRGAEAVQLVGDSTKARTKLGWTPRVDLKGLVRMMVDADFKSAGLDRPQGAK